MAVVAVNALIILYACIYGVSPALATEICRLESDFAWDAIGDNGLAVGPFQIHLPLWREQRAKMGLPTDAALRFDPVENVRTAMFTMSQGLGCRWSTYDKAWYNIEMSQDLWHRWAEWNRLNTARRPESIVGARLRRIKARYEGAL